MLLCTKMRNYRSGRGFLSRFSYDAKGSDANLISWDCAVVVQAFPSVAPPIMMVATKAKARMHGFGWDMPAGLGNMLVRK